eukprot:scaffold55388_cov55-Phaeocystis_antarctica.AAC.2
MKTSRPVDARLKAAREDPGLQSEPRGEYTRPHIREGPGIRSLCAAKHGVNIWSINVRHAKV